MMPHYYIWTIGCQMNRAESERLEGLLQKKGYQPAEAAAEADLIILNSCVVRQHAENRVLNKLAKLRPMKKARPSLRLALTGCLVDSDFKALKKRFPYVDYFFKPGEYPSWLEKPESGVVLPPQPSVSSFVTIIQGCDNFCSYCIVPYRRGREKSRPAAEIAEEVAGLAKREVKEVTLLGQNVDSYGHDLPGKPDLASLLYELNDIEGIARLRFLTNHPKDMSDRLIKAIAELDKVCEQMNLPVQSGDDGILKAMGRGYTAEDYRWLVSRIRSRIPQMALSTDVIVGFPGESQQQFQNTFNLLAELRFDTVHVAAYSPREGTIAAREYEDDVPKQVKKERLAAIEKLQQEIAAEINARLLGETVEVLVEGRQKGRWQGRSRSGKLVFFTSRENMLGRLVDVKIEKTSPWALQGSCSKIKEGK